MKLLQKLSFSVVVVFFLSGSFVALPVFADNHTTEQKEAPKSIFRGILPIAPADCQVKDEKGKTLKSEKEVVFALRDREKFDKYVGGDRGKLFDSLGCAIKLGKVRLFMVPFFITYLIQFLLQIAGLIAVLFVVIGGYQYIVGGLIEEKEKGKNTLKHALTGFVVALLAWIIVNFIQVALTS